MDWLGQGFWGLVPESAGGVAAPAHLDEVLRSLVERARSERSHLEVTAEAFVGHLAGCLAVDELLQDSGARLHAGDLLLACACALGLAEAHAVLERELLSRTGEFLARQRPTPAFVAEVSQAVREKLLLAPAGRRPRIAEYSGRSPLANWLRVVVSRTAIDLRRGRSDIAAGSSEVEVANVIGKADPEMDYLRRRYQPHFLAAIEAAMGLLTVPQRNALRLHYVERLTLDQVATALGIHRATVARHIALARDVVVDGTRDELARRLGTTPQEFESLAGLVRSQLDLSLARLLR